MAASSCGGSSSREDAGGRSGSSAGSIDSAGRDGEGGSDTAGAGESGSSVGGLPGASGGGASGRSAQAGQPSEPEGGAAPGEAGQSGAGGAGSSGLGGAGVAGQAGANPNPFSCGTATPVLDPSTGLEQCSAGYVRRTGPANCPSMVPRTAAVSGYDETIDECQFDADCADTDSPYAHCGVKEGGFARVCVDGCVEDGDCSSGQVCRCGDPVGRCVPATCSTGTDCGSAFDCAEYQAEPGCFSAQFACQTPADTCASDADCAGSSPNPSFCRSENGARRCTIVQCTTP
ncbi:MAG TPA: hypothetical protein VGK73_34325 [Polyangiaceae bacterium]